MYNMLQDIDILVDGFALNNPGYGGFRGVNRNGIELFSRTYLNITNNLAEYLGVIAGLWYVKDDTQAKVYTDSMTAIKWVQRGNHNSTLNLSGELTSALNKAEDLLYQLKNTTYKVQKWNTKKYGEILADYGNK